MGILATTTVLTTLIVVVVQNLRDWHDEKRFSSDIEDYVRKETNGPG